MLTRHSTAFVIMDRLENAEASRDYQNQVAMLKAIGFQVSTIFASGQSNGSADLEPNEKRYWKQADLAAVDNQWVCSISQVYAGYMEDLARGMVGRDRSWTAKTLRAAASELPSALFDFCKEAPPELILCSHLSLMPLAIRLKGPNTRIVVETCELSSSKSVDETGLVDFGVDYRAELSAGRAADGIVFRRAEEADAFENAGVMTPSVTIAAPSLPGVDPRLSHEMVLALTDMNRAELVKWTARMIARLIGTGENPGGAVKIALAVRQTLGTGKLLLYKGSDHGRCQRELQTFLDLVFFPQLRDKGYILVIEGSICGWAMKQYSDDIKGCVYAGSIPGHRRLYELPAITVLPVLENEDEADFDLDVFASGQTVVGTPAALQGWESVGSKIYTADIPCMAEEILAASDAHISHENTSLAFSTYVRKWVDFLSSRLNFQIDFDKERLDSVPINTDVSAITSVSVEKFLPIEPGNYPVTANTVGKILSGSFGFQARDNETGWLWTSSWYCGFLFESRARQSSILVEICNIALPDWAEELEIDIFIDGASQSFKINRSTDRLIIPIPHSERKSGENLLMEIFLPYAIWDAGDRRRAIALCITKIETLFKAEPALIKQEEFRNLENSEFVAFAYSRVLGKEPDIGGLEHYLAELGKGIPREEIIQKLAGDPDSILQAGVVVR